MEDFWPSITISLKSGGSDAGGKVTQVTFTVVTDDDFDAMSVTKYFKGG